MSCTLGADPELFVLDPAGKPVSAHKFFPYKPKQQPADGQPFRDGYVVELNPRASTCRDTLLDQWCSQVRDARGLLPAGYSMKLRSSYGIDLRELADAPDDLKEFGCDPSFDAYSNGKAKHPEVNAMDHPFRYAGGHMHFGWAGPGPYSSRSRAEIAADKLIWAPIIDKAFHPMAVKLLDLYVGLPMTYLTARRSTFLRREVYGQAGEYRPQVYSKTAVGLEYRTPGPEMWADIVLISLAYLAGRQVLRNFALLEKEWNPRTELALKDAINHGDGMEALLPTLPGVYTPELLKLLRADKSIGRQPVHRQRSGFGWQTWLETTNQAALVPAYGAHENGEPT